MPTVDLTEDQIALLEMAQKSGGAQGLDLALRAKRLHDQLYNHGELGASYQEAIKKLYPDAPTDIDRAKPFVSPLDNRIKALEEELQQRRAADEERTKTAAQNEFDTMWNSVVSKHSLTEEGQEQLLNFMKKRKLGDPEAAAALYYEQNPIPPAPIVPAAVAPQTWTLHDPAAAADDTKELYANPEKWADGEIARTLTESRRSAA